MFYRVKGKREGAGVSYKKPRPLVHRVPPGSRWLPVLSRGGAGEVSEATEGEKAKVHQPWWKRWLGVES